jgi:hypothetical protein
MELNSLEKELSLKEVHDRLWNLVDKNPDKINILDYRETNLDVQIYTEKCRYSIHANSDDYGNTKIRYSYLGCVLSCRNVIPGECWLRGRDLPDGPCTEKTWQEIVQFILNQELVSLTYRPPREYESLISTLELFIKSLVGVYRVIYKVSDPEKDTYITYDNETIQQEPEITNILSTILKGLPTALYPILLAHENSTIRAATTKVMDERGESTFHLGKVI